MNHFRKVSSPFISTSILITTLSSPFYHAHADVLEEAFSDGKASANIRYRYEAVDDSTNDDAGASTLRTRLGFTTSDKFDLSVHMDFEHVTRIGDADFNSTLNGQTQYAVVADPATEELNQAFLKYKFMENGAAMAGRQRIILDNARFIGNVGWRQNEQTFDAIRISSKPVKDLTVELANLQQINTITGGSVEVNANLLNVGYGAFPGGKLTGYAYLLEYDKAPTNSNSIYGLRYKGKADKLLYTLEYATQADYGDNPNSFDTDYLFGELGYKIADKTSVFIAMETLGSDDGAVGFQTPLATKHAFNGWADKFLGTPANGLKDTYLKAVSNVGGVKLVAMYHDFSADNGSADYGTELDLLAVKKLSNSTKVLLKFADYDADTFSTDTQKIWLALEVGLKQ